MIGFIPAIGDMLDAFMAMMVLRTCQQVEGGLPVDVKSKMMFNIIVDFFIGLVPFIGDLADAVFRANTKNAAELEKYLRKKGVENLRKSGLPQPRVDPSDGDEFDRMMSNSGGSTPEYNQAPVLTEPMRTEASTLREAQEQQIRGNQMRMGGQQRMGTGGNGRTQQPMTTSDTTTTTTTQRSEGGWFGFGKKQRQPDVESGVVGSRREDQVLPNLPQQNAQRGAPQQPARTQKSRR